MTTLPSSDKEFSLDHARRTLKVALPDPSTRLEQNEEWFLVKDNGRWRELGMHDYSEIFNVPGLYERVVYDVFRCRSPWIVKDLFLSELKKAGVDPASIEVLDLGAGNGYVAEVLSECGVERFVGVDIIPEAAEAAERDRPGLYDEYVIGDLTDLPSEDASLLERRPINCMTCVAALGFGDIPPQVFVDAFNYVENGGWAAFTIKSDFLQDTDPTGFSALIKRLMDEKTLEVKATKAFTHRFSTSGDGLEYTAIVGIKHRDAKL